MFGEVTIGGEPVVEGKIYFEPVVSQSNDAPAGFAIINKGNFDSNNGRGKGVLPGPHTLKVSGKIGEIGKAQFYRNIPVEQDIESRPSELHIEISREHAEPYRFEPEEV
ncbi:hypothetical protein [Calycomorphotria hydatis]|uniref:hypothetical protein n=1 Tax=Calycomorphotria hydatis TaxID=2528027 RepID=UPI001E3151CA|nr:hypothetical protein [Calycomorphotria hydatis]